MPEYQRAVPVLQVANVETSLRWYVDVLGFKPETFPSSPPYSFAILRRDDESSRVPNHALHRGIHELPNWRLQRTRKVRYGPSGDKHVCGAGAISRRGVC